MGGMGIGLGIGIAGAAGVMGGGAGWYYNLPSSLSAWQAAIETISPGEKIPVLFLGSSIGVGQKATNPTTEGYFYLLQVYLESKYGIGGLFYRTDSAGWTAGSGWSLGTKSIFRTGYQAPAGTLGTLSITLTGKSFDVHYVTYTTTSTFTAQLDADAPVTMGGVGIAALRYYKETLTAASYGAHTITITPGAGAIYIAGININYENDGLIVSNASKSGNIVGSYDDTAAVVALDNHIDSIQPKLTVIGLSTNDYWGQTALATYSGTLDVLVDKALLYGSCILLAEPRRGDQTQAIKQTEYEAAMRQVALAKSVGYIDLPSRWGGYKADFMNVDATHPNTAGHADMASALEKFL